MILVLEVARPFKWRPVFRHTSGVMTRLIWMWFGVAFFNVQLLDVLTLERRMGLRFDREEP